MASEESERRQFYRITDRLFLEFREVSPEESLALEQTLKGADLFAGASTPASDALPETGGLRKNKLYAYLECIDRKLDTLIELLSQRDNLFQGRHCDVTISGSGLKFCSPVGLNEGAFLEVRVGLSPFPGRRIAALGRTVRVELCGPEHGQGWETAVTFTAISEKDRDTLVAYIFSREREGLRTKQVPDAPSEAATSGGEAVAPAKRVATSPTEGALSPGACKASACEALSGEAPATSPTEGALSPGACKASACEALSGEAPATSPTEGALSPGN